MRDDCNSGVIQVEPGGDLPVGDDEDVPHPGGVSLHGAQRVAELLVVLESARRHVLVLLGLEGRANGKKKKKYLSDTIRRLFLNVLHEAAPGRWL